MPPNTARLSPLRRLAGALFILSALPAATAQSARAVALGRWYGAELSAGARNLALYSNGARASASSTAPGFQANGVLDGDWSARNWGKGHGWQSAKRHEFPVTFEVRLPQVGTIDTLMLATWPAVVHGVNWMGVRNFDVEVEYRGGWVKVLTLRANTEGLVTIRLPATPASPRMVATFRRVRLRRGSRAGCCVSTLTQRRRGCCCSLPGAARWMRRAAV